jgi:hypothetical protein
MSRYGKIRPLADFSLLKPPAEEEAALNWGLAQGHSLI